MSDANRETNYPGHESEDFGGRVFTSQHDRLSYSYKKRSDSDLEEIADVVLNRYAHRRTGLFVNIEGIIEDCGIRILPRQGNLFQYVEAYTPRDPHFIVVPELSAYDQSKYRPSIAEEFAHIMLEWNLWETDGHLPDGSDGHELSPEQYREIEDNAEYLALALLMPKNDFVTRFNKEVATPGQSLEKSCKAIQLDFQVWYAFVAYRAADLNLISEDEVSSGITARLLF